MFDRIKAGVTRAFGVVVAVAAVPMVAHAQTSSTGGPDFSALTGGVDFTTTIAAVLAVAALLVGLFLAVRGAKIIIGMVRGA
ncbi:hypothetical protein QYH69_32540 [Paraburkholderia sp. SARCC-3016]|uniref:hypothetical protein n=1 Tax=Paraburkholderia sp. SARCC-3016 TaxID=3058611 RepID=UPI0028072386|nr:hypothetical protein [Paraburkholderia sp. SARCC-3016]MDQ7981954.1 hypothetical protein [Paraburkholderia sp. SARCC-3016]